MDDELNFHLLLYGVCPSKNMFTSQSLSCKGLKFNNFMITKLCKLYTSFLMARMFVFDVLVKNRTEQNRTSFISNVYIVHSFQR